MCFSPIAWAADARRSVGGQSKQNFSAPKSKFFHFRVSKLRWWWQSARFFAFYVSSTSPESTRKSEKEEEKLFFWNSANDRKWSRPRSSPKDVFFSFLLFRSTFLLLVDSRRMATTSIFLLVWFAKKKTANIWRINLRILRPREVCAFAPNRRLTMTIDDVFIFCLLQPHVISLGFEGGFVVGVGVSLKSK